jgi:hypothetical protein
MNLILMQVSRCARRLESSAPHELSVFAPGGMRLLEGEKETIRGSSQTRSERIR